MKNTLYFLLLACLFSACKKAVYNRNCCEQAGTAVEFFGGYMTLPNAFTPDGDSQDDTFTPIMYGVESYTMRIILDDETLYDGENAGWNGEIDGTIEAGIYGYIIDITTSKGDFEQLIGQVCSIPTPADACLDFADNCRFASQYIPDTDFPEELGEYDPETTPSPVFCDE